MSPMILREIVESNTQMTQLADEYSVTWMQGYKAIQACEPGWVIDLYEAELATIEHEIKALARFVNNLQEVQ